MKKSFLLFLFIMLFSVSCRNGLTPSEDNAYQNNILYSNSFENLRDTSGWKGYAMMVIKDDSPESGGKKSLFVSGGCIVPHAYKDLNVVNRDSHIRLQCWAKIIKNGGVVYLQVPGDESQGAHISVMDSTWKFYKSEEILFIPAGKTIRIGINAGGFIEGSVMVDKVEIIRIP